MNRLLRPAAVVIFLSVAAFADRLVQDESGRQVSVPDHARRLVCLAPNITDMVYALGRGQDIVGITDYTKYPPEARQKPSVGGVINPSLERLVSLKPDLVLAVGGLNNPGLIKAIERVKLAVFVIDPHGLHDIYRSLENLGVAIDAREEALALISKLRAREAAVRQKVAGKARPNVFFLLWADPIMTAGQGAFITELIDAAGGHSVTADMRNEWPRVSFESVLARDPEYLLLVRGSQVTLESLRRQGNWTKLRAIREGKLFYADERIEYPSPVVFDALEDLANQFHPASSSQAGLHPASSIFHPAPRPRSLRVADDRAESEKGRHVDGSFNL